MKVTVIGAGNSGIAMTAHVSKEGNEVTLWNRTNDAIAKLKETHLIHCDGMIRGAVAVHRVTDDIRLALEDPNIILITTPANSHKGLAELIAKNIQKSTVIVLNPGRTFGAFEFKKVYEQWNQSYDQIVAEAQTTIYTCRKTAEDSVDIIALKDDVLLSSLDAESNQSVIACLPTCMQRYFIPAQSMIQTSIGNVGMVLHCAPLILNSGWTESKSSQYKYYYEGITPTVAGFIECIDHERVAVSEALGHRVETTMDWLKRTYHVSGNNLYECIQNNEAYKTIDAPISLQHRYVFEDIPCGLVPLEAIGLRLGIDMSHTTLIIDLASKLMKVDFRETGRNLNHLDIPSDRNRLQQIFERRLHHA